MYLNQNFKRKLYYLLLIAWIETLTITSEEALVFLKIKTEFCLIFFRFIFLWLMNPSLNETMQNIWN